MRGGRTLALLVLVLVPVAYFASKEYRNPTPATDTKKLEKVFSVESDKIEEVAIKSESGERTTLRKAGADWQVVAPADGAPLRPTRRRSPGSPPICRPSSSSVSSTRTRRI